MTNPGNDIQHEYGENDALLHHGILGARWVAIQHEDEIKHYGVKGMKWGVRKDGKPQGYQGPSKKSGKSNSTTKSAPSAPVPTGGGGGSDKDEEEDDMDIQDLVDDMTPAQKAYLNQLMEENGGRWSVKDIREAAKKTFTPEEEAALTKKSVSERAGEKVRGGLDALNRLGEKTGMTEALDKVRNKIKDNTRYTTSRTAIDKDGVETKVAETRDGHGNVVSSSQSTTQREADYILDKDGKVIKNPKKKKG